ncbi:MAG: outer membrane beta-barrel protein [Candidatus Kapaibacterium sp.]
MKNIKLFLSVLVLISLSNLNGFSQENDISKYFKNFSINAYIDTYYSIDNDKSAGSDPRMFDLFSPYRDQISVNIAQLSLKYNDEKIRGTFTMHFGDIPDVNWTPVTRAKYVQEANIGFSPVKNLWIDGGYFLTHIGAESFPRYNFFSSFSLPADYEPFLQSGLRIGYDFSEKFSASLYALNGFNMFEDNNKNKSAGMQLNYKPLPELNIVYNNIIGNEQPTGIQGKTRMLNNLIFNVYPHEKIDIVAAADFGLQEKSSMSDSTKTAYYCGASVAGRYRFSPNYSASIRGDFFQDLEGVVSLPLNNGRGVKANSLSLGFEYKPVEKAYVRFEYRYIMMDGEQTIFEDNSNTRSEATITFGFDY